MKDLVKNFFSDKEKENVIESVKKVEKITSGEIVPMIVSSSYHYPVSNIVGGVAISLPFSLILTMIIGPMLYLGYENMWVFLGFEFILFTLFYFIVKHTLCLKRFFISPSEIEEEVSEAAITNFYGSGLYKTRDETGVLIFISIFERKVWILADRGINKKVNKDKWDTVVGEIIQGIKEKKQGEAICHAIESIGYILKEHFPVKHDDTDELDNLIMGQ